MADIDHQLTEMGAEECAELLVRHRVGRVAYEADGQLHIVPMNYTTDPEGRVVVRTTSTSVLYRAALDRVAFQIDGIDERSRTGWSVCVHASARAVADGDAETAALRSLPLEPWAPGQRHSWFVLQPVAVTGRRLALHEADPRHWYGGIPLS
jgi:nitroimidazol reductase NimA-like FMN-containing flavoprotein (pyridoxamine 5'-phosphate oxidase superfamily)